MPFKHVEAVHVYPKIGVFVQDPSDTSADEQLPMSASLASNDDASQGPPSIGGKCASERKQKFRKSIGRTRVFNCPRTAIPKTKCRSFGLDAPWGFHFRQPRMTTESMALCDDKTMGAKRDVNGETTEI